jgi:hypothetical protein
MRPKFNIYFKLLPVVAPRYCCLRRRVPSPAPELIYTSDSFYAFSFEDIFIRFRSLSLVGNISRGERRLPVPTASCDPAKGDPKQQDASACKRRRHGSAVTRKAHIFCRFHPFFGPTSEPSPPRSLGPGPHCSEHVVPPASEESLRSYVAPHDEVFLRLFARRD